MKITIPDELKATVPRTQWGRILTATPVVMTILATMLAGLASKLRYMGLRYEAESRLNQAIANVYELQVRQSNLSAERHQRRSQRFFVGMLAAQAAVIISTFSIAAQRRSLLWSLAAAAGLAAVVFAIYVYFYI